MCAPSQTVRRFYIHQEGPVSHIRALFLSVLCPKYWYYANGNCYHYTWSDEAVDQPTAIEKCKENEHTTGKLSMVYTADENDILR